MRRILALVMTLVIGFSLGDCVSYAAESQADNAPTVFFEKPYDNNPVTPERIVHSYYVSVKVPYSKLSYPNLSNIPTVYYYSEYNKEFGAMFHGSLSLQSVVSYGNAWEATYTGTISGNI